MFGFYITDLTIDDLHLVNISKYIFNDSAILPKINEYIPFNIQLISNLSGDQFAKYVYEFKDNRIFNEFNSEHDKDWFLIDNAQFTQILYEIQCIYYKPFKKLGIPNINLKLYTDKINSLNSTITDLKHKNDCLLLDNNKQCSEIDKLNKTINNLKFKLQHTDNIHFYNIIIDRHTKISVVILIIIAFLLGTIMF